MQSGGRANAAYAAASIQLYSRLWLALETLSETLMDPPEGGIPGVSDPRVVLFRLELLVLLDACGSARWHSLLGPEQRDGLRSTLEDLMAMLAVPAASFGVDVLYRCQNHLFEAVRRHFAATLDLADRSEAPPAARAFAPLAECLPA